MDVGCFFAPDPLLQGLKPRSSWSGRIVAEASTLRLTVSMYDSSIFFLHSCAGKERADIIFQSSKARTAV